MDLIPQTNQEEIKAKRKISNPFDEKIAKLKQKSESLSVRIKQLRDSKKEVDDEIEKLQNEKIIFIVKQSNLTPEEVQDSVQLSCIIKQSGLSNSEVRELVSESGNAYNDSSLDLNLNQNGGDKNV